MQSIFLINILNLEKFGTTYYKLKFFKVNIIGNYERTYSLLIRERGKVNNIAIITARSGSKGLRDKNIKMLCGKPLMAYSIEAAINSKMFKTIMVSTDSEEYACIAKEYGAEVPFLRTPENSTDKAGSWETVAEVVRRYYDEGVRFETVCLLQPTSPLRLPEDII